MRTSSVLLRRAALGALLVAAFTAITACSAAGPSARVTSLLGGPEAVSVLSDTSGAVKREAWRIDSFNIKRNPAPVNPPRLHDHPILAGPVAVDDATAAEIAAIFLDDDTYRWDVAKGCEFDPGVVIRETRGATVVDILLCFSCDEAEFHVGGKRAGIEDTDARRADLLRIARRLFPDDPDLAKLR